MMNQPLSERFFEQIESYDQLTLDYHVQPATEEATTGQLVGQIQVNGVLHGESYAVEIRELAKSASASGEFFIFTCGCGSPQCAGIERRVTVVSNDGITVWKGYGLRPRRVFVFDTQSYRQEILRVAHEFVRCFKQLSADQVERLDEYVAGLNIYVTNVQRLEAAIYEASEKPNPKSRRNESEAPHRLKGGYNDGTEQQGNDWR